MTALVDELLMRERREIGRWAEQLLAQPGGAGRTAPGGGPGAGGAHRRRRVPHRGRPPAQHGGAGGGGRADRRALVDRPTRCRSGRRRGPWGQWEGHLEAMEAHSRATGDPLAAALAQFDRTLVYEMAGAPERGEEAAEALLDLAAERSNPSLRSMALLSHAQVVAQDGPGPGGRRAARGARAGLHRLQHDRDPAGAAGHRGAQRPLRQVTPRRWRRCGRWRAASPTGATWRSRP